jgi:hypothetical protein
MVFTGVPVMSELTREQILLSVISGRGPAYLRGIDLSKIDLSNAGWLVGADLHYTNLSHANLSGTNLKSANLHRSNLDGISCVGTNLEEADLQYARITGGNLRRANLRGANLHGARLVGAILVKVNLEGADLEGADLEGANLEGAILRKAVLSRANLHMANLRGAIIEGAVLAGTMLEGQTNLDHEDIAPLGFDGTVSCVGLSEVIQIFTYSRSDLRLRVGTPEGFGTIFIRSGEIIHAETADLTGEDAIYEILSWDTGTFDTLPFGTPPSTTIDKPIEHLMVESLRRRDESMVH